MKSKLKKQLRFLPPLLWMTLIFYLSSRQRLAVSGNYLVSFVVFKTLHIIEYGFLFFLWCLALRENGPGLYKNKKSIKLAAIISILYGMFDELHQTLVPTREGRLRDVFIDSLGVFIFWKFFLNKAEELLKRNKFLKRIVLF